MKPLIGITGRRLRYGAIDSADKRFADIVFDSVVADYARCVAAVGGIPVHLPFEAAELDIAQRLDALIVTGGADIHPSHWGGPAVEPESDDPYDSPGRIDNGRDRYELALVEAFIQRDVPVLGVCRGHQVINVALGGTLVHDIPPSEIVHYSTLAAPHADQHAIACRPGTIVHSLYGPQREVNSWHHQSVDHPGDGLVVTATAPDGVVEAIELPGRDVLGLQWHPEWDPDSDPVFEWLVARSTVKANSARSSA
ncbi:gamma-glutamyl-gamma-aminobutyrate hydrolase family protein [Nocardia pseudovaccinii]|uniref:gamma-glutamyl-gamma-aminobutyrate hydrolase family protein n=1 Tax=Nocardia pseudovaccinii TaxID=189540 RepID=UPI0007A3ADB2|nr:gamma-glutamyl-gamma-aminobutyrate hydrolase family protein [Nocardia pseudovaccinii]